MSAKFFGESPLFSGEVQEAPRARFSLVLRNRSFLLIWFSQLVAQLADRFLLYVLLVFAYQSTHSNLGATLPMLAFGIPSVLFSPSAGVLVDRFDRRWIMVFCGVFRGLFILSIIPFINSSIILAFVIAFLTFTVTQIFAPAETASIPSIVEKRDLIAANSLFMMTLMGASIVGIGLAAPLNMFLGDRGVLVVAAALHFMSGTATFFIRMQHRPVHATASAQNLYNELKAGFGFILREGLVAYSLAKMFFATAVLATISLLAIEFSEKILKIGAENFGYLVFAAGAGMVLGGVFLGRFSYKFKKGSLVTFGFVAGGAALLCLACVSNLWQVIGLVFVLGVGNAFIVAPLQTILHEKVPPEIRGRVFGVQHMVINSAFTFPVVIFGEMADKIGLTTVIVILGVLVIVGGIFDRFISKFKDA